ncbi:acyl-CoA thioesterase-2 [Nocardioides zeae]|uniref:Acyl-CoA thioesterase 2 n=2 Tax=Nocardioides zeae TaxID=1457234 RepID=A0AAJ1X1Y8_9ACTN|nr:acyl-CoA thioesterase II [Nocardioides zeae]MDQ1103974.1 acyl-CoA thioesterase-2 [Nocardioides zeae]MDR6176334.1 acyl-CoA thioesterase-2 [Nocardioides zeae]MDR6210480.1 acyl-CoA thioesterase-2 [Nocardioides zeae]
MPQTAAELLDLLDLETIDVNLFRGRQPDTVRQRVFGGQVAAQAFLAGARTVDADRAAHSLHAYFLRPGDPRVPIVYDVERLRDGRSFSTRRVVARQHGRDIFYVTISFQVAEDGFEHQTRMPSVPAPEDGMRLVDIIRGQRNADVSVWEREWSALDVRYVGISGMGLPADEANPAQARIWVRIEGDFPDDPVLQQAAFVYASDLTLLGATLVPHGTTINSPGLQPASLDHTVWFHRAFRADRWWLYDQESPSAGGARGFATAGIYTEDGGRVASVAQEGLIRRVEGPNPNAI